MKMLHLQCESKRYPLNAYSGIIYSYLGDSEGAILNCLFCPDFFFFKSRPSSRSAMGNHGVIYGHAIKNNL